MSLNHLSQKWGQVHSNALKFVGKGDYETGVQHLEAAVKIDPEFLQAQVDLAKCYLRLRKSLEAVTVFSQVVKLDPKSPAGYAGSSLAFLSLRNLPEAERAARRALEIDPGSAVCRYVLGMSLAAQDKSRSEALEQLRDASGRIPDAYLAAGQIYQRNGQNSEARTELEGYLKSSKENSRNNKVKEWLKYLNGQTNHSALVA
ncbi:MAG: tetratricopeptide repeat protein [Terriglobales bacterium]